MRLLRTDNLEVVAFSDENVPAYAILSHTWGEDEVTFQDMQRIHPTKKKGYEKVKSCCSFARANGFEYVWIDTCCIDKTSSAELSEAINSMYRWYQEADVCYGFLADVPSKAKFSGSRWFTRGWTLQELIAPSTVIFLNESWDVLGTKASLWQDIEDCTGISAGILSGEDDLETFSIAQRMSWAAKRTTSRIEDRAYCLLGMFGINMPLIYGEREGAFIRLQEEIMKISDDQSLFAWKHPDNRGGLLATSPAAFTNSGNIVQLNAFDTSASPLTTSNRGVHFEVKVIGIGPQELGLAILRCQERSVKDKPIAIYVKDLSLTMDQFERVSSQEFEQLDLRRFKASQYPSRRICIRKGHMTRRRKSNHAGKSVTEIYPNGAMTNFMKPTALLEAVERGFEDVAWLILTRSDVEPNLKNKNGLTALSLAVRGGHETIVKMLLARSDIDAELEDEEGRTLLTWAAIFGHSGVVKLLLKSTKTVADSMCKNRQTPLSWAAENGHEAVVQVLLDHGAEATSADKSYGRTPLSWAAAGGHQAVVRLLLQKGVHVETEDRRSQTPLFLAAENGHEAVVRLLLDKGANAWAKDSSDWIPQLRAAANGHKAVVQLLLDKGANTESTGKEWYEAAARLFLDEGTQLKDEDVRKTPLLWAAEKGCEAIVRLLLDKGVDIDVNDRRTGRTPLLLTAKNGHVDVVKLLLSKGAEAWLNERSSLETPLSYAAGGGHEVVVQLLLDAGASTQSKNQYGRTPLWKAVIDGHTAVVRLLLDNGASVEVNNGSEILLCAAERGYDAIVQLLVDKGADIDMTECIDRALFRAAEKGHVAVVRLLLEKGADFNSKLGSNGKTPLVYAAEKGHEAIVQLLLENGADVEAMDEDRYGPLSLAAQNGHEAVVRLLLDKGANPESGVEGYGWAPLIPAARNGHEAIVRLLLEKGANANPKDAGEAPLLYAAQKGHEAIVKLLLEKDADTEANDGDNRTPLLYAAKAGYEPVVRLLLENGANTEVEEHSTRRTPLLLAVMEGHKVVVQLLLDKGANVESVESMYGRTALSWAAQNGHGAIVRLLLEKGANVKAVDKAGQTPLLMAGVMGHWTIVQLMKSHTTVSS